MMKKKRERSLYLGRCAEFTGYICLLLVQGPISLQRTALLHSRVRSPRGNAASYHGCHGCQAHQGPWLSAAAPAHGAYGAEEKKASTTSRHQADCIGQIFLWRLHASGTSERHSCRPLRKGGSPGRLVEISGERFTPHFGLIHSVRLIFSLSTLARSTEPQPVEL
ncbi:unnamed protein product [Heterotrigona itama]|uniref:Uncharacterized protein n=1 Tax=Heterotrigona itama TaxID=395501 RepID=A0A6V7H9I0_9HYME|nr:unnamed protein product [Heterotrigona itama]